MFCCSTCRPPRKSSHPAWIAFAGRFCFVHAADSVMRLISSSDAFIRSHDTTLLKSTRIAVSSTPPCCRNAFIATTIVATSSRSQRLPKPNRNFAYSFIEYSGDDAGPGTQAAHWKEQLMPIILSQFLHSIPLRNATIAKSSFCRPTFRRSSPPYLEQIANGPPGSSEPSSIAVPTSHLPEHSDRRPARTRHFRPDVRLSRDSRLPLRQRRRIPPKPPFRCHSTKTIRYRASRCSPWDRERPRPDRTARRDPATHGNSSSSPPSPRWISRFAPMSRGGHFDFLLQAALLRTSLPPPSPGRRRTPINSNRRLASRPTPAGPPPPMPISPRLPKPSRRPSQKLAALHRPPTPF